MPTLIDADRAVVSGRDRAWRRINDRFRPELDLAPLDRKDDLQRRGLTVGTAPEGGNAGIDAGCEYSVGEAARSLPVAAAYGQKVMQMPPDWRTVALEDAQQRTVNLFADWSAFVDRVSREIAEGRARPRGASTPVGFLPAPVVDRLASGVALDGRRFAPVHPSTAMIATTDRAVYHALRDKKFQGRDALAGQVADALKQVPEWTARADVICWDSLTNNNAALLFGRRQDDGSYLVLVVRPDYAEKRSSDPAHANWVRTIKQRTKADLQGLPLLSGELK